MRVAVLETTAVDVIIKDQDDLLEDDLIGVACTSVHSGSRWLDLIRQGVAWVTGAVKLQVVFRVQPSGATPTPLVAADGYTSVNSTATDIFEHANVGELHGNVVVTLPGVVP